MMATIRQIAAVALACGLCGCFVSVGGLGMFQPPGPLEETVLEGEGRAKVLLLEVERVITDTPSRRAFGLVEQESTLARVQAALDRAADDRRVRALVLRIDSPGGGVTASDQIYTELVRFKQMRGVPVVASLGDVAASGGYYVACAADQIVAHPTTVTGSIGVILTNLNVEGLFGKIGVRNETFKAGEHKDLLSPFREVTREERRMVDGILASLHARFVTVVRDSRPQLDTARLPELTDGRIFSAEQALAVGLVDQIGDLRAAIAVATRAAGLEGARVVTYHRSDQSPESIYAAARDVAPERALQVNVLPLDLGAYTGAGPRFMYLWQP
jgi:protease-4